MSWSSAGPRVFPVKHLGAAILRRVSIRVPAAEAEMARARLIPLAPRGFEEIEDEDEVELAVYVDTKDERRLQSLLGNAEARAVEPGWEDAWRDFHRPVRAGGLWIGPPWAAPADDAGAIVVDPGRAFGTGGHPTTRACIELLARVKRGSILDAGCGSGVIAVAGARLDFDPIYAIDADPTAAEVATRTAHANGVQVEVRVADVLVDELPRVDLVVANIELPVVEGLLARRPAARAITSGYLRTETPSVDGWAPADRIDVEGWAGDLLVRV